MNSVKFEDIDYFLNKTEDCGTEICFYDSSKYKDDLEAFGHELRIYPYMPDLDFKEYFKWMEQDGIKIIY